MVKNLTSSAGDLSSSPDGELRSYKLQGNWAHVPQLLSWWSALESVSYNKDPAWHN